MKRLIPGLHKLFFFTVKFRIDWKRTSRRIQPPLIAPGREGRRE